MRLNPRYVFFASRRRRREPPARRAFPCRRPRHRGRPGRHGYGELYWIDAEAPALAGAFPTYRRLVMALDTGGAIKGEVRADLYLGQGDGGRREAGRVRHTLQLYRLVPGPVKRPLRPEEVRLWSMVAATVEPCRAACAPKPRGRAAGQGGAEHRGQGGEIPSPPPAPSRHTARRRRPARRHRAQPQRDASPASARRSAAGSTCTA